MKNKYPQRTDAAQAECQHVIDVFNNVKGNSNKKNTTVHVFLHEDGTVSVGISGKSGSIKTINAAKELEVALNDGLNTKKYTVGSVIDVGLANVMEKSNKGIPENYIGDCAEPKAATVASKNSSPIVGMDTRNRLGDATNHKYSGSDKTDNSQMSPCKTCKVYEKEYMELANRNKRYE